MIGGGYRMIPDAVKNLLILNVLAFVALLVMYAQGIDLNRLAGLYYWKSPNFEPYQLVTHMFMHGGFIHIFFNMFALWMFGSPLEQVWGPKRFLTFYFVTGLGAALLHLGVIHFQYLNLVADMPIENVQSVLREGASIIAQNKNYTAPDMRQLNLLLNVPTVGASGAVYGILLGFGMLFPNTRLMLLFPPIPIKAKYFVIGYAAIELYMGISNNPGDNIAHFAHLGGMLFGFILIKIWQKSRRNFF